MLRTMIFSCIGYLSGSILYARVFGNLLKKQDITADSPDQNPGTFNAFKYGGFLCGTLTLICDIMKGLLPVYFYVSEIPMNAGIGLAFVLAMPVIGHILPLFYNFDGGKGIAVTFGCLLGLLPEYRPVLVLAFFFLLFSLVFKITPNYHKTLCTYAVSVLGMSCYVDNLAITLGFALITIMITVKLLFSREEKEKCKVELTWKH